MDNNVIGFIGVDMSDILFYLSRILYHLEKRIILVDLSDNKEIINSLANKTGLDLYHYNGVDITCKMEHISNFKNYDHVFIYYGFRYDDSVNLCNRIVFTTDMNPRHIALTSNFYKELAKESSTLISFLIRNVFDIKIKVEYIIEKIHHSLDKEKVACIYADFEDMKTSLVNQYNLEITFQKISPSLKQFLKEMVIKIEPSRKEKEINAAYKKAERGYVS